ncbi:hypothetical protein [Streptomyces sp. NPDC045251]|uniref:hypothetical protein n=1 Tax=unclassified Streptomyces TaxID=2593676 RepID=UPI0033C8B256
MLIPLLDALIGPDQENPPEEAVPPLEEDRYYRWCTYLYLPLQYAGLLYACLLFDAAVSSLPLGRWTFGEDSNRR